MVVIDSKASVAGQEDTVVHPLLIYNLLVETKELGENLMLPRVCAYVAH